MMEMYLHKYNEDIFKMIQDILESKEHSGYGVESIDVGELRIVMGRDEWESHDAYILEVSRKGDNWDYRVSVGKSPEEHYKNTYPNGCYVHFDSDGFYNLVNKLGYDEDDDVKMIYEHLKKYCRNINIEKILEDEIN